MKKLVVLLLAGVLCLGALTGCGKSDEQKAQEEIAQHLREEAAADGVDLDKEIADEMAAYEEKHEAFEAEQAHKASSKEEIENTYFGLLDEAYYQYENSEDPANIEEMAHIYNDLYDEMLSACEAADIHVKYSHYRIRRDMYLTRMAFYTAVKDKANPDTQMWVYSNNNVLSDLNLDRENPENYDAVMLLVDENIQNEITHVTIVKNGTDVVELAISEFGIPAPYMIDCADGNSILFVSGHNGSFLHFKFDFSGNTCQLVEDGRELDYSEIYIENYWHGNWDVPTEDGLAYIIERL